MKLPVENIRLPKIPLSLRFGLSFLLLAAAIGVTVKLADAHRKPRMDYSRISESTWAFLSDHTRIERSAAIDSLTNTDSSFRMAEATQQRLATFASEYPRLDQNVADLAHIIAGLFNENIIWYERELPGIHEIDVTFYLRDGAEEEGIVNRYDLTLHTLDPAAMIGLTHGVLPPSKTYLYLRVTPEERDEEAVSVSWNHPDLQGYPESFTVRDMSPRESDGLYYVPRPILGGDTDFADPLALVNAVVKNILDAYEHPVRFIAPYLVYSRTIPLGPREQSQYFGSATTG